MMIMILISDLAPRVICNAAIYTANSKHKPIEGSTTDNE